MAHLSSRTLRSFPQSSETSWTVAWKWMLRKEVEEKSCFRLERLVCTSLFLLFYLSIHHIHCCAFSLFFPSIPSWSWQSHFPVSPLSSWQPRRRWRAIASLSTELPCLPMLCTDMCQPISFLFFFVPDNWLWVTCFFGCTSLKKALTNLTVKKTKNLAQLPPSTRTLVFRSDIRRQVKLKCLVSE